MARWAAGGVGGETTVVLAGTDLVATEVTDIAELVPAVRLGVAGGQRPKDAVAQVVTVAAVSKKGALRRRAGR